jgi:hypothetical protein
MKSAITALILAVFAAPSFADDGNVSPLALNQLGLSSIQVMSDVDGDQIRGQVSFAFTFGASQASANWGGSSASSLDGGASGTINRRFSLSGTAHGSGAAVGTPLGSSFAGAGGFAISGAGGF